MGDRKEALAEQPSLFGRGEQQEQIRRLRIPSGLKWGGSSVSPGLLKSVLEKVDDFDRGGNGGRGCYASVERIAEEMQRSEKTIDRALSILTHVLGFLTNRKRKEGLRTIVDRRVCFAAIRAFNEGERPEELDAAASEGEGLSVRGGGLSVRGEGLPVRGEGLLGCEARDVYVPQTEVIEKESPPTSETSPDGDWGAVVALLRERGLTRGPALIAKARAVGASPDDILSGLEFYDQHARRNGWKPAALGWWVSNWQPYCEVADNWPKRKAGGGDPDAVRVAVEELRRLPDERLEALARELLAGPTYVSVRQICFEWGFLRSDQVLQALASEGLRRRSLTKGGA